MAAARGEKDRALGTSQRGTRGLHPYHVRRTREARGKGKGQEAQGNLRWCSRCLLPSALRCAPYFPAGFTNSESATPLFTVHLSTVRTNVVPMTVCSFFVGINTPPNGL